MIGQSEKPHYDLIVAGGGPAGTAAAITAARAGLRVLIAERGRLPRQKVCGEFVSAESLRLLEELLNAGRADEGVRATCVTLLEAALRIAAARVFAAGKVLEAKIQPPAASIARYELDWALWQAARAAGAECRQETMVKKIARNGVFRLSVAGQEVTTTGVIDASGRWSNLRSKSAAKNPTRSWIGLKAHFTVEHGSTGPAESGRPRLRPIFTSFAAVTAGCSRCAAAVASW